MTLRESAEASGAALNQGSHGSPDPEGILIMDGAEWTGIVAVKVEERGQAARANSRMGRLFS